jgi:CRP-like cAMP-binding protein
MPEAPTELVERLRAVPLFADLGDEALTRVVSAVCELEFPAGHVLIQQGHQGSGLFVIEEGAATVELPGAPVTVGPGEFVGELSLLAAGLTHSARVRAATPVRCLAISRSDFADLLAAEPRIAVAMLPVLARRLADTDRLLAQRR